MTKPPVGTPNSPTVTQLSCPQVPILWINQSLPRPKDVWRERAKEKPNRKQASQQSSPNATAQKTLKNSLSVFKMFVDIKEPNHLGETFLHSFILLSGALILNWKRLTPAEVNIPCT